MSINDRMLNEHLEEWIKHVKIKEQESKKKAADKQQPEEETNLNKE